MSISCFATTPEPPYFAVIFTSVRTDGDQGYAHMADAMVRLAAEQPGFLGIESVRGSDGLGITVSYWASAEDIKHWKMNAAHLAAQSRGTQLWYEDFFVRVAKVERAYGKTTPR